MKNHLAPILVVSHTSLKVFDESSAYKRLCPVCDGLLLVGRHRETLRLVRSDMCVRCGQRVWYSDEGIGDERFDEPASRTAAEHSCSVCGARDATFRSSRLDSRIDVLLCGSCAAAGCEPWALLAGKLRPYRVSNVPADLRACITATCATTGRSEIDLWTESTMLRAIADGIAVDEVLARAHEARGFTERRGPDQEMMDAILVAIMEWTAGRPEIATSFQLPPPELDVEDLKVVPLTMAIRLLARNDDTVALLNYVDQVTGRRASVWQVCELLKRVHSFGSPGGSA